MTDLDGYNFKRVGGHLVPADIHADAFMRENVKDGREVLVSIRKARNLKHHRFFRALLTHVVEATGGIYADDDDLLEVLCEEVGHGRYYTNMRGERRFKRRSTSFAAMDQVKFKRFVDRCLFVFEDRLGIDATRLLREVDDEQGGVYAELKKKTDT